MALDETAVARIATLARIKIAPERRAALGLELSRILSFVDQLSEVDTTGVPPMTSVANLTLPLREDVVTDGDCAAALLANAPAAAHGYFTVPKVVE